MVNCVSITIAAVSIIATVAHCLPEINQKLSWDEYKRQYNKSYASPEEDSVRKELFENRANDIDRFNHHESDETRYQKGVNHLTDLTDEEFKRLNGLRVTERTLSSSPDYQKVLNKILFYANQPTYELPGSVDWRSNLNRVSPVKNQGNCGSCWAFATVGVLEGQEYRNSTGSSVTELSEQNLIDCDSKNKGCRGGIMSEAIDFVIEEGGLMKEEDYPYDSSLGYSFNCSYDRTKSFVTTWDFKSSYVLPVGDEKTLQKVVATYGPVAVGIYAESAHFRDYTSGVFYDESCVNVSELTHGVLVVGYGTDEKQGDYWLIKNSWSEAWGEKGYLKLARNRNNHCGVADVATIAI